MQQFGLIVNVNLGFSHLHYPAADEVLGGATTYGLSMAARNVSNPSLYSQIRNQEGA